MAVRLTSIHRYPVKSMRGASCETAVVEPWGLAGDRRWMVVDAEGGFVTARRHPRLLAITTEITATGVRLSLPGAETLEVGLPDPAHQVPVRIWSSVLTAAEAADAAGWLSDLLGFDARLVYLDDPTRRAVSPTHGRPEDRVGFADGYPLLVTTEASLAALNAEITAAGSPTVPMHRFRPNLVVDGEGAWDEDRWRLLRIGDAVFRAVKGCARCVITTHAPHPASGRVDRDREPLRTLARIRRFGSGVWFGVNLIPDTPGVTIAAGDAVEVLEVADAGTPPLGS